jgi:predicted GIY-YIG superfamily endonuclease
MKYLYSIENNISGKRYIGVTIDPVRRWKQHTSPNNKKNSAIKDAIQSYGEENFTMTLLCFDRNDVIDSLEVETIKKFNTLVPNGYNFTKGGDGASYMEWKEEWNELLGTDIDSKIGKMLGYSGSSIAQRRGVLGIPSYRRKGYTNWDVWDSILGTDTDKNLAKRVGVCASTVENRRNVLGINPYRKANKKYTYPKELIELMGKEPDTILSEMFNIPSSTISNKRVCLGIERAAPIGWRKRVWTEQQKVYLEDRTIKVEDVATLLEVPQGAIMLYRREHKVGKYTGRDKSGKINYIPLEGELLSDMLIEEATTEEIAKRHGYDVATIKHKRESKAFLEIKNKKEK